ncbi:MAG: DUF1573 domain-containing protein [Bacteroidota bacterium]|nr:DUF1573 domain-containing protein [Bacteroidota bacterium]
MKRLHIILFIVLISTGNTGLKAQFSQPAISFEKMNHNFGVLKEADGIVEHVFSFTNTGSEPLIIKTVRSTCGCTVPDWSKEPIMPMGKGTIKVSFNPANRPGAFRKGITVVSNAREPNTTLYVVGLVQAKTKTVADEYPMQMDGVRFKSNHMAVTRIKKGEIKTDTLKIYNNADISKAITIPDAPDHLRFEFHPSMLMPKQKGEIIVHYDAGKVDDWGFVMQKVYLHINGLKYLNNLLAISASIEENFDNLSAVQMKNAPKMDFEEEAFNFGTITRGEIIKHVFNFKNNGKETLLIRKMSSTCGCTVSEPSAYEIPPGASGHIEVTFNSTGKIGKQFQTITLITNDPRKTTKLLRVIGTVNSSGK